MADENTAAEGNEVTALDELKALDARVSELLAKAEDMAAQIQPQGEDS
jgi:hypothetical protein